MSKRTIYFSIFAALLSLLAANILAVNTLTVNNDGHGGTTPSGTVPITYGVSVPISATPQAGYHFVNWTKTVGTGAVTFGNAAAANTTITVTSGNPIIQANFALNQYILGMTVNRNGFTVPAGTVTVYHGVSKPISATPRNHYHFVSWVKSAGTGTVVFGNANAANTTVVVTGGDATIKAKFAVDQYPLTITDNGCGTTIPSGAITINYGAGMVISATPNPGYYFLNWVKTAGTGTVVFGNENLANTTVYVTGGDAIIKAKFAANRYILTILNNGYGTTTPSGAITVKHGTSIVINATTNPGYHFVNWVKTAGTGTVVFGDANAANTTVIVTGGEATIKAKFTVNQSPTPTPVSTPTVVPTNTPTPSPSPTITPTDTPTPISTDTPTPTPSPSEKITSSPTIEPTATPTPTPTAVPPTPTLTLGPTPTPFGNIVALAAGASHGLALKNDGTVWAWGGNADGQLGNRTYTASNFPVQVSNVNHIISVSAGFSYSIALKNDGTVWGWGRGPSIWSNNPFQISGYSNITAISAGGDHMLALKNDGTVWAAGDNYWGQVGTGSDESDRVYSPVQVSNLTNVIAVAAGEYHSLALRSDGTVWAWGCNYEGELGDGTNQHRYAPVQVVGLQGIVAIDAGYYQSLAIKNDGTVWAWGSGLYGQLGIGPSMDHNIPVQVSGLNHVIAISGCENHSLAVKSDGTVWSSGLNNVSTDGNGGSIFSDVPVRVNGIDNVTSIAGGYGHSLALKSDGTAWAWGVNNLGQLGNGVSSLTNSCTYGYIPTRVGEMMPVPYLHYLCVISCWDGLITTSDIIVTGGVNTEISAVPYMDYRFVNWTQVDGTGTAVFGDANLPNTTVIITGGDVTIQANFVSN